MENDVDAIKITTEKSHWMNSWLDGLVYLRSNDSNAPYAPPLLMLNVNTYKTNAHAFPVLKHMNIFYFLARLIQFNLGGHAPVFKNPWSIDLPLSKRTCSIFTLGFGFCSIAQRGSLDIRLPHHRGTWLF